MHIIKKDIHASGLAAMQHASRRSWSAGEPNNARGRKRAGRRPLFDFAGSEKNGRQCVYPRQLQFHAWGEKANAKKDEQAQEWKKEALELYFPD